MTEGAKRARRKFDIMKIQNNNRHLCLSRPKAVPQIALSSFIASEGLTPLMAWT